MWAVTVTSETKVYSTNGKYLRRAAAGIVLDVAGIKNTRSGEFALCRPPGTVPGPSPILISTQDLDIRYGDLGDLSAEERGLCSKRGRLIGEIARMKKDLSSSVRTDNPHAGEYLQAKEAYKAFLKKARALQSERDGAEGDRHVRVNDELRAMKGDDIRLGQAFETAKQKYDAWNRSHPREVMDDPRLLAMRKNLAYVEDRLTALRNSP
jgi:hypothetical protein